MGRKGNRKMRDHRVDSEFSGCTRAFGPQRSEHLATPTLGAAPPAPWWWPGLRRLRGVPMGGGKACHFFPSSVNYVTQLQTKRTPNSVRGQR